MSNTTKTCCLVLVTILSFTSCSTLLSNRKNAAAELAANESQVAVDSLEQFIVEIPASEPMLEASPRDTLFIEPVPIAQLEEEPERMMQIPHFEGDQTTSVVIPEYKGIVVEDMVVDLCSEDNFYPADGYITSKYGWRKGRMHAGIDIKAYTGDNLYAAFDGVVRLAKYYSSFGNCVIIRHYNGLETLYAHASKLMVEVNDEVKAGDIIALAGNTGRSTGSHLHFEVRVAGHYIDPALILDTENRKIKDANLYVTMRNGRLFASNNDSEQEREDYIISQISIKYHIVRSGDVLSRIAANNGTTVATICRLNGISSRSTLRIGQRLIVRDGVKVASKSPSEVAAAKSAVSTPASTPKSVDKSGSIKYIVRSGDTLSQIATRNNTTITAICNLSGISRNSRLNIGQVLYLPASSSSAVYAPKTSTAKTSGSSTAKVKYVIKSGDTLSEIATRNNTTVTTICNLSGLSRNARLSIGQVIYLPASSSSSSSAASTTTTQSSVAGAEYHYVKSGDTLSEIAEQYHTTVSAICRLNGITATSTLNLKQRLRVR
ncbi:MAG: LysM peptidoglycan-binding domain-containing protein [Rikenellaceae bacterium]